MLDERWENMKIKAARVFGNSMRRLVYPGWAGKSKKILNSVPVAARNM
jgi:hypothetical protein